MSKSEVTEAVLFLPKPGARELEFDGDVVDKDTPYGDSISNFLIDVFANDRTSYSTIKIDANTIAPEILTSTKELMTDIAETLGMEYNVALSTEDEYHLNIRMKINPDNKFKEALDRAIELHYCGGPFYEPPIWKEEWKMLDGFEINDEFVLRVTDGKIYLGYRPTNGDCFTKADRDAWYYFNGVSMEEQV